MNQPRRSGAVWVATTMAAVLLVATSSARGNPSEEAAPAPSPPQVTLNEAPMAPLGGDGGRRRRAPFVTARHRRAVSVDSVDTSSKASVTTFFNDNYDVPATYNPTSSINPPNTCVEGDDGNAWREATIRRVNLYRRLVGLPLATLDNSNNRNEDCRKSSLIQSANGQLSHSPTSDWDCWSSEGKNAAGSSNIAIGSHGPDSIDGYVDDPGTFNDAVGHRRWILYPPRTAFATGDVGDRPWQGPGHFGAYANTLWTFGPSGSRPASPSYVVWPNAGYVPYQLLPSSRRWSISVPGVDFSGASASAKQVGGDGTTYTVVKETVKNGYGDNTLVFRLTDVPLGRPEEDIEIDFVVVADGETFSWTSTIFDPNPSPPCCNTLTLSGISHSIATTYTLQGKVDGYCHYANAANNRFIYHRNGRWHIGATLFADSFYSYNPDAEAGRPEDVTESWLVWNSGWVEQPNLVETCEDDPVSSTTPAVSSTASPTTLAATGVWYCRKPGNASGKFKTFKCELDCGSADFRSARCCRSDAGGACKKSEKVAKSLCADPKPKCP